MHRWERGHPARPHHRLGIYVQVPFCASKCSFCNFSSQVAAASVFDAYVAALGQEIERLVASYDSRGIPPALLDLTVDSVYFGGGTPSLLGAERLANVVATLRRRLQFTGSLEFTLELTPGSADDATLATLRRCGVNRLSIGAQSFDDRELRSVGRLHSADHTRLMTRQARSAGFDNISLDLIAGLPYQTESSWTTSLHEALHLKPEHISVYLFEVDEKSRLGNEVLRRGSRYHASAVPSDEFMADAYEKAREVLRSEGCVQYEISNFARPGYESRHNRKYWRLEPYVGLGAGAHSFDGARRWSNEVDPERYQEMIARGGSPIVELRELSLQEQMEEFFFLGLRQREGVSLTTADNRWGTARLAQWEPVIGSLETEGWVERNAGRIRIADRALLVSNEVFEKFLV